MGAGGYKDAWRGQMKCPQMSDDTGPGAGTPEVPFQNPVPCPGPPSSPG